MNGRDNPTQRTEKGHEIPVPKRGEFFRNLAKIIGKGPPSAGGAGAGRSEQERPEKG